MKSYILVLFLFISCNSQNKPLDNNHGPLNSGLRQSAPLNQKYVLDTIMVKSVDLTDRPENELVIYHLQVTNWKKPVIWSFYVLSGADTLLEKYSDEASIDTSFYDDLYVKNCKGYLDYKKKWYLDYIFNFRIEKISPNDSRIPLFKNLSKFFAEKNIKASHYQKMKLSGIITISGNIIPTKT